MKLWHEMRWLVAVVVVDDVDVVVVLCGQSDENEAGEGDKQDPGNYERISPLIIDVMSSDH